MVKTHCEFSCNKYFLSHLQNQSHLSMISNGNLGLGHRLLFVDRLLYRHKRAMDVMEITT